MAPPRVSPFWFEPDVRDEAQHEIAYQSRAAGKARRVLGWSPRFTLEKGLRETIRWYVRQFEREADL